ncbi:hypothetical protein Goklo_025381 [Gossypium klotzschianum]|uniref:Uncharacterized protein n=1 Tax=Gossypium klotzschianum TaxID=34286 RepID=A0A7J8W8C2_9ROSI|nr:hypothetical protein [Gossypium klotzschianum]
MSGGGQRGSKRGSENDAFGSNKSSKTESSRRVGRSTMLMEKLDAMIQVVTVRSIKDTELMNLEACTFADSSHTLVDFLTKLVSLPSLIPSTLKFCFACTLIEDPQKMTILNGLPDHDARLHWIKYLLSKVLDPAFKAIDGDPNFIPPDAFSDVE